MKATLQDIFKSNYESYKNGHGVSIEQHQASEAIMACGTEELGYEEWVCLNGDHVEQEPHSCRHINRLISIGSLFCPRQDIFGVCHMKETFNQRRSLLNATENGDHAALHVFLVEN